MPMPDDLSGPPGPPDLADFADLVDDPNPNPTFGWDEPPPVEAVEAEVPAASAGAGGKKLRLVKPGSKTVATATLRTSAELLAAKVSPEPDCDFGARAAALPAISWLAADLVPSEGVFLFHGRPRSMKSLNLLALAIDLAYGRPAFSCPRFQVPAPVRVLYVTEEDSERLIYERRDKLLRGAAGGPLSGTNNLQYLIKRGISLDSDPDRSALLACIDRGGFQVVIFEPMRTLTTAAEGTAADFKPIADWMRHLQSATACKAIGMGAHWRKPSKSQAGGRSESLSGGALFSFSDCLVSVQKVSWNESLMIPEDYKLSSDPPSFLIRWNTTAETSSSGRPLFGESISPEVVEVDSPEDAVRAKHVQTVVSWLADHPWQTAPEIATGCRFAKHSPSEPDSVYSLLSYLCTQGIVRQASKADAKILGRSARAKLFALAGTEVVPPPAGGPGEPA